MIGMTIAWLLMAAAWVLQLLANRGLREVSKNANSRSMKLNGELEELLAKQHVELVRFQDHNRKLQADAAGVESNYQHFRDEIKALRAAIQFHCDGTRQKWESDDVSVLSGFLKSKSGQQIISNLSVIRQAMVQESLHSKTKCEFNSGRASGWSACVNYIRLSAISAPSEPQSDDTQSGQPQPMMGRHVLTTLGESTE